MIKATTEPSDSRGCSALVQIGVMGTLARFEIPDEFTVKRGDRVICRTGRGMELGEVKSVIPLDPSQSQPLCLQAEEEVAERDPIVGPVVRHAEDSDFLAFGRLDSKRMAAVDACALWLQQNRFDEVLLDAETPLDGQRIYFHFLGPISERLEKEIDNIVKVFDDVVGVKKFTEAIVNGCGPDCGSDGSGCNTGGACGSCSLKGGCTTKKRT